MLSYYVNELAQLCVQLTPVTGTGLFLWSGKLTMETSKLTMNGSEKCSPWKQLYGTLLSVIL